MSLSRGLSAGQAHCAKVRELAVVIGARRAVLAEAEGLVAVLELQVLHGLCQCCDLLVFLKAHLNFPPFFLRPLSPFTMENGRVAGELRECLP